MTSMKSIAACCMVTLATTVIQINPVRAQDGAAAADKIRVGTFDSRAVAVAYASSDSFSEYIQGLRGELARAKEEGNEDRVKELEALGPALQHVLHKQGFSTWPIDNILDRIRDRFPAIASEADVSLIVSKWDVEFAADNIEYVDVTDQMVQLFDPDERTLQSIAQLREQEPVPLDEIKD